MICAIYLDDILIWSFTVEEHLERLEAVFKRLAYAELKLKPSKCSFFQDKTGYLGYVISSNGVKTDPSKIEAVTQWRIPMNVDDKKISWTNKLLLLLCEKLCKDCKTTH